MLKPSRLVLSADNFFLLADELLKENMKVVFRVSGRSMWPLLRNRLDSVLLAPLGRVVRRGDIVLMKVPEPHNRYILHRVYKVSGGLMGTQGDGCLEADPPVPLDCVLGRVEAVLRGKRTLSCDGTLLRAYTALWMAFTPLRGRMMGFVHVLGSIRRRWLKLPPYDKPKAKT